MNLRRWLLSLVLIMLLVAAPAPAKTFTYLTTTVEEIAASARKPVSVGFDVDDTVLSLPRFLLMLSVTPTAQRHNKYGPKPLSSDLFWKDMSCDFDRFCMLKEAARDIIEMHKNAATKSISLPPAPKSRVRSSPVCCTANSSSKASRPQSSPAEPVRVFLLKSTVSAFIMAIQIQTSVKRTKSVSEPFVSCARRSLPTRPNTTRACMARLFCVIPKTETAPTILLTSSFC